MPPSPAVIVLWYWNEKQPQSPKVPTNWPLNVAPQACAQSSTTRRLCFLATPMTASMLHGMPRMCTHTMPFVAGVIFFSMSAASIVSVSSISAMTGMAFAATIAAQEAKNV